MDWKIITFTMQVETAAATSVMTGHRRDLSSSATLRSAGIQKDRIFSKIST